MLSKIISNIISLNPTGTITLDNNGIMKMNGQNNIIQTPSSQSKDNLQKISNNKFICNKENIVEKFDNINSSTSTYTYFLYSVLIIFIFIISFFIFKKILYKK